MRQKRCVYIVDDNTEMRRSTALLLSMAGYRSGAFSSGLDFLEQADELEPGIILVDVRMPVMDGLQFLEAVGGQHPKFVCVMITGHGDIEIAVDAIKKGARDFLEKPFAADSLFKILDREFTLLETSLGSLEASKEGKAKLEKLTFRERQVLQGLVRGKSNKLIAHDLGISVRTVEMHRASAMDRLGCRSLAEAVSLTIVHGIPEVGELAAE